MIISFQPSHLELEKIIISVLLKLTSLDVSQQNFSYHYAANMYNICAVRLKSIYHGTTIKDFYASFFAFIFPCL